MKHLLLLFLFLFSGSLDSFSQARDTSVRFSAVCYHNTPTCTCSSGKVVHKDALNQGTPVKPDTLRAIILVTLTPNGIAHARMGFVVIAEGKEVKYLDCRKRALKLPAAGWGYRLVNHNDKVR